MPPPRHRGVAQNEETQWPFNRATDPDSRGYTDRARPYRPTPQKPQWRGSEVVPVQSSAHAQRLTDLPGAGAQITRPTPPFPHDAQPGKRIDSPNENRARIALGPRDHVQAPVYPVASIDVRQAGWTEHGGVSPRSADPRSRMGGRIRRAEVCLHLHDDPLGPPAVDRGHEALTEKLGRHFLGRTGEEALPGSFVRGRIRPPRLLLKAHKSALGQPDS